MITDKLGVQILPGSIIVYGTLLGRSAALRIGKVLYIKNDKIRVVGIDKEWRGGYKLLKPATLSFSDRTIVLNPNSVIPDDYMDLLNTVEIK